MALRDMAKAFAARLFDDYDLYWIVAIRTDGKARPVLPPGLQIRPVGEDERAMIAASPTAKMRSALQYGAAGAAGVALFADDRLLCVAHVASGSGWDGGIWPLAPGEAGLSDVVTEEAERGRGHAVSLLRAVAAKPPIPGTHRLVAHIWWTHRASLNSFRKAGWRRIGFSARLHRGRRRWTLRPRLRA